MSAQHSRYARTYLFTVRLWTEDMGSAETEIRGEVRHVLGGEVRYFRDCTTLTAYLTDKMLELPQEGQAQRA